MGISKRGFVSEINVTPFVDVMLVLLIIFMVTAPMMDQGLDVDLPQARQVDSLPTDAEHLVLTITRDGAIYMDTYQVPLDELETRLVLLVRDRNRSLFMQADKDVPYGFVVDVMGRIKAAGIEKLGVVALPADQTAPSAGIQPGSQSGNGRALGPTVD